MRTTAHHQGCRRWAHITPPRPCMQVGESEEESGDDDDSSGGRRSGGGGASAREQPRRQQLLMPGVSPKAAQQLMYTLEKTVAVMLQFMDELQEQGGGAHAAVGSTDTSGSQAGASAVAAGALRVEV